MPTSEGMLAKAAANLFRLFETSSNRNFFHFCHRVIDFLLNFVESILAAITLKHSKLNFEANHMDCKCFHKKLRLQ